MADQRGAELVVDERPLCAAVWGTKLTQIERHECNREPAHEGRHVCVCGSWCARGEMG